MSAFNEFIEKLQNDEEFAGKVNAAIIAGREAGESDDCRILASVARESGYAVTEEEIKAHMKYQKGPAEELSEEEMGKVSGGFLVLATVVLSMGGLSYAATLIADALRDK